MKIETIYSIRSKMDCIRKGIGYLIHRPWLITKVMGPWALLFSCLYVLEQWYYDDAVISATFTGSITAENAVITALFYILLCVVSQLFYARMFILFRRTQAMVERKEVEQKINEGEDIEAKEVVTLSLKERINEMAAVSLATLPYTIWLYLLFCPLLNPVGMLLSLVVSQPTLTRQTFVAAGLLVAIIVIAFFAMSLFYPLYHSAMTVKNKRMEKSDATFKQNLKIGFRHKGKTFTVTLLSFFIVAIISIIPCLPAVVSSSAYTNSLTSVLLQNDEAVIPSSGMWLMYIASALSCTLIMLIYLIPNVALLYLYGSITVHEKEKGCPQTAKQ